MTKRSRSGSGRISDPEHVEAVKLLRRKRFDVAGSGSDVKVEQRRLADYDAILGLNGPVLAELTARALARAKVLPGYVVDADGAVVDATTVLSVGPSAYLHCDLPLPLPPRLPDTHPMESRRTGLEWPSSALGRPTMAFNLKRAEAAITRAASETGHTDPGLATTVAKAVADKLTRQSYPNRDRRGRPVESTSTGGTA